VEKFFFKKIDMWAVLLLAVAGFVGLVFFAAMVRNVALGFNSFGRIGQAVYAIASVPAEAKDLLDYDEVNGLVVDDPKRFGSRRGWVFDRSTTDALPDGYLLFSRYDGDKSHHIIEFLDLNSGKVEHRIDIDADALFEGVNLETEINTLDTWNSTRFRAVHPVLLDSGDLMIKSHWSPLFRISSCGDLVWKLEDNIYHHSTETAADGTFWLPTHIEPTKIEGMSPDFLDNGIVNVTADGTVLYRRSLAEVMLEQGYGPILFTRGIFDPDPMHLNDVQPVSSNGEYWQKGDLFLSLRHISTIMLFRPSTDEIIWMKQGPWAGPHDVDIVDDHTIAVFNNNMFNMGNGEFVDGTSDIIFYDFANDTVSSPFKNLFETHDIKSKSEGLFSLLPSQHLLIEEAEAGRFLIFSKDEKLVAEHVNRAEDGNIYDLGWSRFIERDLGDRALDAMTRQNCP
jgi:hypothetical protein